MNFQIQIRVQTICSKTGLSANFQHPFTAERSVSIELQRVAITSKPHICTTTHRVSVTILHLSLFSLKYQASLQLMCISCITAFQTMHPYKTYFLPNSNTNSGALSHHFLIKHTETTILHEACLHQPVCFEQILNHYLNFTVSVQCILFNYKSNLI